VSNIPQIIVSKNILICKQKQSNS